MSDYDAVAAARALAPKAMGRQCAVHQHREYVPLEEHHIWPSGLGGPNTRANRVVLCSNGHGAVHDLLAKILKAGAPDAVPWAVRRRYGWRIRRLAVRGYEQIPKTLTSVDVKP